MSRFLFLYFRKARRSGIGFGDLCGHAKPCFNCEMPVPTRQGTLRLRPLTRWNWRVSLATARRLNNAVKDGEATTKWHAASFMALFKHFTIDIRFCVTTKVTKSDPRPLSSFIITHTRQMIYLLQNKKTLPHIDATKLRRAHHDRQAF
jgi:hypothetical protein